MPDLLKHRGITIMPPGQAIYHACEIYDNSSYGCSEDINMCEDFILGSKTAYHSTYRPCRCIGHFTFASSFSFFNKLWFLFHFILLHVSPVMLLTQIVSIIIFPLVIIVFIDLCFCEVRLNVFSSWIGGENATNKPICHHAWLILQDSSCKLNNDVLSLSCLP